MALLSVVVLVLYHWHRDHSQLSTPPRHLANLSEWCFLPSKYEITGTEPRGYVVFILPDLPFHLCHAFAMSIALSYLEYRTASPVRILWTWGLVIERLVQSQTHSSVEMEGWQFAFMTLILCSYLQNVLWILCWHFGLFQCWHWWDTGQPLVDYTCITEYLVPPLNLRREDRSRVEVKSVGRRSYLRQEMKSQAWEWG